MSAEVEDHILIPWQSLCHVSSEQGCCNLPTRRRCGAVNPCGLNPQGRDQTQEKRIIAGPLCLSPAMGIEFTACGFGWRHGQHPATESNVPLNPLFWIDGFCRLCAQPLHCLLGLCIPQGTDRKFCFKGCIQIDADRQMSSRSSSGTEGRRTAPGFWHFKAACDTSLFPCSLLSSLVFGCQLSS